MFCPWVPRTQAPIRYLRLEIIRQLDTVHYRSLSSHPLFPSHSLTSPLPPLLFFLTSHSPVYTQHSCHPALSQSLFISSSCPYRVLTSMLTDNLIKYVKNNYFSDVISWFILLLYFTESFTEMQHKTSKIL